MDTVLDQAYFDRLCDAFTDRPDVSSWLYTHADLPTFLALQEQAPANLAVNWSCDSLEEAQWAQEGGVTGLTCVISLDQAHARIKGLTVCPEQTSGIPCADCKLCWNDQRKTIVGFIAH